MNAWTMLRMGKGSEPLSGLKGKEKPIGEVPCWDSTRSGLDDNVVGRVEKSYKTVSHHFAMAGLRSHHKSPPSGSY